jgi:heme/copper-type cytochrome/quinol oxidase subunit 1
VAPCSGLFAGFYYWWPEDVRQDAQRALGKWNFWLMLIGIQPHLRPDAHPRPAGQPRRTYTYRDGQGFNFWNLVATIGAFIDRRVVWSSSSTRTEEPARHGNPVLGPTRGTPARSSG